VIDGWQRRGLGRSLLQALGLAQANGVERLLAIVSIDNVPTQLLMLRAGATGGELEYSIDAQALAQPVPVMTQWPQTGNAPFVGGPSRSTTLRPAGRAVLGDTTRRAVHNRAHSREKDSTGTARKLGISPRASPPPESQTHLTIQTVNTQTSKGDENH
jgi:hypothetical protein